MAMMLLSIGKWRYFLAGLALAVFLGLLCRAAGRLMQPFSEWRIFRGICRETAPQNGSTAVAVDFTDHRQLSHTAAFCTAHPAAAKLQKGDPVQIAVQRTVFAAGDYPQSLPDARRASGGILLRQEQRRLISIAFLRILCRQILLCGGALAVFLIVMQVCFPHG